MSRVQLSKFMVSTDCSVVMAMEKIDANARGILFVIDSKKMLIGSLTDGDIRRFILQKGSLKESVSHAMKKDPFYLCVRDKGEAKRELTLRQLKALPIVDENRIILDIVFSVEPEREKHDGKSLCDVPVVVMAGGKGTRLYPYTKILPKPLIPVGEIPIVERIMDYYAQFGVDAFYMTVNYKKAMIKSYFDEEKTKYKIRYVEEETPLGTGGSLRLIPGEIHQPLFVTNCDALILADYAEIYAFHKKSGNALTVVSALKNFQIPYGVLHTGENGRLEEIEEKPQFSYFINTGMYILNPEWIGEIPEGCIFHMTDLVDKLMEEGERVGTYPVSEDSFLDMGEFSEMKRMEEKLHIVSE